ncbi:glycoside hydrolase family 1 protein [Streptomyces mirabilis]|uniref:glycoside hydrolase family 1 protein n=1 Tax=Streptomyces mirabilis TaxID=68239 RepID=UPI0036B9D73D
MTRFPQGFLWGASTSAHQTEGGNVASDWWYLEHKPDTFCQEPSGDAVDSYHRWGEDMDLMAEAGLTDYRFSIEWARIEPIEGAFSLAALHHYRRMIEGALRRGLRPMITLHHFSNPLWFSARGSWNAPGAVDRFTRYVRNVLGILHGVGHVCTINEPNMVAAFRAIAERGPEALNDGIPEPDPDCAQALIEAHHQARRILNEACPDLQVGWSVAVQDFQVETDAEQEAAEYIRRRQTVFLEAARGDDWIGVQTYTRARLGAEAGQVVRRSPDASAERTLTGWEYYPAALGGAVRQAASAVGTVPVIVTENGVATGDDTRRIRYTHAALTALLEAMDDGIDVRGYFHWSLLDNYEWGGWEPTFGLVAVDRTTFVRSPKASLAWLGSLARSGRLPQAVDAATGAGEGS